MVYSKKNLNLAKRSSMLKNIHATIRTEDKIIIRDNPPKVRSNSISFKWMGIAASLVALLGVLFVLNSNKTVDIQTGFGEIANIDLPDGSQVNLDANSSLIMIGDWSDRGARNLKLKNSAYFNVTNDPKVGGASFNVLTESATVEVIGTEFLVDSDGQNLTVIVKSGKVKVSPSETSDFDTQILTAGDQLVIRNGIQISADRLSQNQVKRELAWIEGLISFDNTSFIELESIVKDRFNKTLVVDEALRTSKRSIDGTYPIMSHKDLLGPVARAFDLQISYSGDSIFLGYPKKN